MNNEPITEKLNEIVEEQDKYFSHLNVKPEESVMRKMRRVIKSAHIEPVTKTYIHSYALNLELTDERRQIEQAYMAGCLETIEIFVKTMKEPDAAINIAKLSAKDFIDAAEQFYLKKYDV
jgi:hypothetical protein